MPNGSTDKNTIIYTKYKNTFTKQNIKTDYKLRLQFILYKKIAVSTKCRHKLLFKSSLLDHKLLIEYFDNILPYSCAHII